MLNFFLYLFYTGKKTNHTSNIKVSTSSLMSSSDKMEPSSLASINKSKNANLLFFPSESHLSRLFFSSFFSFITLLENPCRILMHFSWVWNCLDKRKSQFGCNQIFDCLFWIIDDNLTRVYRFDKRFPTAKNFSLLTHISPSHNPIRCFLGHLLVFPLPFLSI